MEGTEAVEVDTKDLNNHEQISAKDNSEDIPMNGESDDAKVRFQCEFRPSVPKLMINCTLCDCFVG